MKTTIVFFCIAISYLRWGVGGGGGGGGEKSVVMTSEGWQRKQNPTE